MYDPQPDESQDERIRRAVAACPVQAIRIGLPDRPAQQQEHASRATEGS